MKARKKPVEVEVFQYNRDIFYEDGIIFAPVWAASALMNGTMFFEDYEGKPSELMINTFEGKHHVSVGDYVIKGVNGELYPCKQDIFEKTYDIIEN